MENETIDIIEKFFALFFRLFKIDLSIVIFLSINKKLNKSLYNQSKKKKKG